MSASGPAVSVQLHTSDFRGDHAAGPHVIPEEDGIHRGVLDLHYRQWDALSQSAMKTLERSPAHLRAEHLNPPTVGTQKQRNFDRGSMAHMAVLQPDDVERWFQVRPPGSLNSNKYKDKAGALLAENPFLRLMHPDDHATALRIRDSVHAHPTARRFLQGADTELSVTWREPDRESFRCKARLDIYNADLNVVGDMKTCADARDEAFGRQVESMRYYRQASWYWRAAHRAGLGSPAWIFLAVEYDPPYAVQIHEVSTTWMELGEDEIEPLLDLYADCIENDRWPPYPPGISVLSPTHWQLSGVQARVEALHRQTPERIMT